MSVPLGRPRYLPRARFFQLLTVDKGTRVEEFIDHPPDSLSDLRILPKLRIPGGRGGRRAPRLRPVPARVNLVNKVVPALTMIWAGVVTEDIMEDHTGPVGPSGQEACTGAGLVGKIASPSRDFLGGDRGDDLACGCRPREAPRRSRGHSRQRKMQRTGRNGISLGRPARFGWWATKRSRMARKRLSPGLYCAARAK